MAIYTQPIAINDYAGTGNDLSKCLADGRAMVRLFGGKLLADKRAVDTAILAAIEAVVAKPRAGDWCVITYSGHGSQTRDRNGDEPDGVDETLVAANLVDIPDDVFPPILSKLHPKAKGLFITDSCFSGTAHRAAPSLAGRHVPAIRHHRIRYMPASLVRKTHRVANAGPQPPLKNWVHIAGCTDFEYSYEGRKNGVLTDALVQCYSKASTIGEWFKHVAEWVRAGEYGALQHPMLNCSAAAKRWRVPSL